MGHAGVDERSRGAASKAGMSHSTAGHYRGGGTAGEGSTAGITSGRTCASVKEPGW